MWINGHYDWVGGNYTWVGGRYERERAGYRWRDHRWEIRDGVYTRIDGGWISIGPTVAPPALRFERVVTRPGFVWVRGHWDWRGSWVWVPGHHERVRAGHRWRDRSWVQRDGVYVSVEGGWY
ncbi:MAG: YXWGXW repeat-containing protein [Deltaproteobacteria bacterium]|nr:YXWGXW repeat-containing protein [Deltaproteobacteria bacterium]